MSEENGSIDFTARLDTSEAEKDAKRLGDALSQVGDNAVAEGKRIDDAFSQDADAVRELKSVIDEQLASISKLKAENEAQSKAIDELSEAYGAQSEEMRRLNEELLKKKKNAEDGSNATIRMQLRQLTEELNRVTIEYRSMTDEEQRSARGQELERKIEELTQKAGNLRDTMDDTNTAIRGVASDTQNFDALAGGLNMVTSTAGATQGVLAMLGVNEETLMDIQTKLQASLAISNALSVVQNNLQKQSAVMLGIRRMQEAAAATAIAIRSSVEGGGVIVTKAATIAQAAFNRVAMANPYILLAVALLTVVGALAAFTLGTKKATEAQKKQAEEAEKLRKQQEEMHKAIGEATGNTEAKFRSLQHQWNRLKSDQEKNKWVKDNTNAFKELGLKVGSVSDAERVLVDMAPQVIAALKAVAEAEAYSDLYKKAIQNRAEKWEHRIKSRGTGDFYSAVKANDLITDEEARAAGVRTNDQRTRTVSLGGMGGHTTVDNLTKEEIDAVNKYRNSQAQKLNRELKVGYDEEVDFYSKKWDEALDHVQETKSKIPSGLLAGNDDNKPSGSTPKKDPKAEAEALERANKAYLEALEKARREREDADAEATEEEDERTLRQMMLSHERELKEIDREQAELLEKKKAAQGDSATLTEEEVKIFTGRITAENAIYERALEERRQAAADKEKAAMEDYLITYGSYQERLTAIHSKYASLREKARTEGERLSFAAQERAEIDALNEKFGYATQAMADLFADASKKSVKEIQKVIDKYETFIKFMQGRKTADTGGTDTSGVTIDDLKGLGFTDADIERVKNGEINIKDLTDAIRQLKGELGERSPWLTFSNDIKDAVQKLKEGDLAGGISGIGDAVAKFTPAVKELGNQLGGVLGFDTEDFDNAMDMVGALGQGAQAAGQIMSGDFVGGAMSAVSALSTLNTALTGMIDRKHERRIKELQKQIDTIEESYSDLEKAVSMTYSTVKSKNIDIEIEAKQQQITLIQQQIQEERDKKNTDHGRIEEWGKKIHELESDIEALRDSALDAIFGENVQQAIENFASAYAEAWASGESRAEAAKDTVKKMMRQMVTESIKSALQASDAMEKIRAKLQEFYADSVLSPWEQDYVMGMAERLQQDLDRQFGWADSLLAGESSEEEGSSGRFQTMSQETGDELSGRFAAIQIQTSVIGERLGLIVEGNAAICANTASMAEGMRQMVDLQGVAVSHLARIEKNTNELPVMNERLAKIETNTSNL